MVLKYLHEIKSITVLKIIMLQMRKKKINVTSGKDGYMNISILLSFQNPIGGMKGIFQLEMST